jgi:YVTN family beta-propeller protein
VEIAAMKNPMTVAGGILTLLLTGAVSGDDRQPTSRSYLLPNGWTISPAGRQVPLTDLPLNILPLSDCRHALVTTNGYNRHCLTLVKLDSGTCTSSTTVSQSWFGLAMTPDEKRLWWSGGGSGLLYSFELQNGEIVALQDEPTTVKADGASKKGKPAGQRGEFKSGVAIDAEKQVIYSLEINAGKILALSVKDGSILQSTSCGKRPYDVALSRDRSHLYVSDWAGRCLYVLNPGDFAVMAKIPVGEHPNQVAVHPTDGRIFVACASSNSVAAIDSKRNVVTETIATSLFPKAPEGSTPDALAIAADGKTLYVANADNNCVAVVDIAVADKSQVKGFIPTGWYPTAVAVTPDGKQLLVGVGKGNRTSPNPIDEESNLQEGKRRFPYIGTLLSGSLSIVPVPGEKELADYTAQVYRNCPYSDKLLDNVSYQYKTAIPTKVGDPSPIKHVIYIIKENRTYDQVFGDIKEGNGDPSLVMFGEEITPNHHKMAREFVLLDNLYCNGQVSRDGHPWSTMAYNTDYAARDWMLTYSSRKGVDDDEAGDLSNAPSGYLWDACAKKGLSYRSYGEYGRRVSSPDGNFKIEGAVPGLVGHMCPDYGLQNKSARRLRDTELVEVFLREFRQFEKNNNLPAFIVMSLGEDHTSGTKPGAFTPTACVASNDLALGRLIDAVSHSKYWPETAIFVIEDDAQNGPDHVDAHRTVGLVVSPYTKRRFVDSSQYSTVSLIRSMELILGLAPLSQYDAAARPMFNSFTDKPDLTTYSQVPARADLSAVNPKTAYGAARSARMDFSEYDKVDDFELNEILWRAIKGERAPLPAPVRRAIAYRPLAGG